MTASCMRPSVFAGRRPPGAPGSAHELDADGPVEGAGLLAASKKLRDRQASLFPVVLRELVDVHAHEAVGELGREPAPETEGVLERLGAVLEPGSDRLPQDLGELEQRLLPEVATSDVDPERKRKTGLEEPPLAEVDDALEPAANVRQLALVNEEARLGAAVLDLLHDLVEPDLTVAVVPAEVEPKDEEGG